MAFLIGGANTTSDEAYTVANSCRFEKGDSAYMHKTPGSEGNRTTWTFSTWVKIAEIGTIKSLFGAWSANNATSHFHFGIGTDGKLNAEAWDEVWFNSNILLRDLSAWYHIVLAVDTTQGTAGNRVKLYVNNVLQTSFSAGITQPDEDAEYVVNSTSLHAIGPNYYTSTHHTTFDGYMAEVVFIDGSQLTPSSFGEADEDSPTIWKPKDVSGLTFGTNGFYLDFEASDNLGNDANGGVDLTEVNLAAADQAIDTPTNNFCTFNPLYFRPGRTATTFSQGNCKAVHSDTGGTTPAWGTIMLNHGKWYYEMKVLIVNYSYIGTWQTQGAWTNPGLYDGLSGVNTYRGADGKTNDENVGLADYGDAQSGDDIVGCAFDCDTGTIWFSVNGVWQNSATQAEVVAGTTDNAAFTGKAYSTNGVLPICTAYYGASVEANFGGCSAFAVSSGNADDNGYGNFEYDVPTGYYAICTKNLAEFGG